MPSSLRHCIASLPILFLASLGQAQSWSFGLMTDTQGASDPDGVSDRLMAPIVDRFLHVHGIDMMIQVGDLTEDGTTGEFAYWKSVAQPLSDAGIPLFPTRGNHDIRSESEGVGNDPLFGPGTPFEHTDIWDAAFPNLTPGTGVTDPRIERGPGASYAFTYENTRFVSLDIYGALPTEVITYLQSQSIGAAEHMFVYGHEPFFGRAREGVLGDDPLRYAILQGMAANGVDAYFSGHDHQYSRSGAVAGNEVFLHHLVSGSASEKTYRFENEFNVGEEVGFAQINDEIGYSVVTIDGAFVTLEHYSSPFPSNPDPQSSWEPVWSLADRFTFASNGDSWAIQAGESYIGLESEIAEGEGFLGTKMEILGGMNDDLVELFTDPDEGIDPVATYLGKNLNTGWKPAEGATLSDILYLGGAGDDPLVISLDYNEGEVDESTLRLAALFEGYWVDPSHAAALQGFFINGAQNPGYGPGSFGIDLENNRVWATVYGDGYFAVVPEGVLHVIPEPRALFLPGIGLILLLLARRRR